jgi:ribosomal protein S27E
MNTNARKVNCRKIEVKAVVTSHGFTTFDCWTCGRALEVTPTGYRHITTKEVTK